VDLEIGISDFNIDNPKYDSFERGWGFILASHKGK